MAARINGLEAARYIKQTHAAVKIIMLSTCNEDHLIEKGKQYGAQGCLLKNSGKEELLQTIHLVAKGNSCFPCRSAKIENSFDSSDNFLRQFNLTRREFEIIQLIKNGYTNQQMAARLYLGIYTIETHPKNIMQKLAINTPASMMKFIVENNL